MKSIHMKASELQLGDNVWEHNVIDALEMTGYGEITVNKGRISEFKLRCDEVVMVTNR